MPTTGPVLTRPPQFPTGPENAIAVEKWELIAHALEIGNGRRYRRGIGRRLAELGMNANWLGYVPYREVELTASLGALAIAQVDLGINRTVALARAAMTVMERDAGGRA